MEKLVLISAWLTTEGPQLLTAVVGALTAVIGVCLLIPGDQPEKALQKVVDFLAKFSRK